jgi:hypothetical protein
MARDFLHHRQGRGQSRMEEARRAVAAHHNHRLRRELPQLSRGDSEEERLRVGVVMEIRVGNVQLEARHRP